LVIEDWRLLMGGTSLGRAGRRISNRESAINN
jgi:hypothetical protein